jgi:hypothetical protein
LLLNDPNAAIGVLDSYFSGQFLDQIASTGEQPFEAIRSRPYHYRAFNIEAMIVSCSVSLQRGFNKLSADECKTW